MPRGGNKGNGSRGFVKSKLGKRHKKTKSSDVTVSEKALKKKVDKKRMKTSRITEESGGGSGLRESDLASFDRYSRNNGGGDYYDELSDDELSEVSSLSIFSIGDRATDSVKQQAAYDELTEHFAEIESKDASVRVEAYGCLNHALGERVFDDFLMDGGHMDDVGFAIIDSLKKGGTLEIIQALKCAKLVAISLQTQCHLFYTLLKTPLLIAIKDHSELKVRLSAIDCLTCLLWCSDMSHTESSSIIAMFEELWKQPSQSASSYSGDLSSSSGSTGGRSDDEDDIDQTVDDGTEIVKSMGKGGHSVPIQLRTAALESFTWLLCQLNTVSLATIADGYTDSIVDVLCDENPSGSSKRGKALNAKAEANLRCAAAECLCLLGSSVRTAKKDRNMMNDDDLINMSDDDEDFNALPDFDWDGMHYMFLEIRDNQGSSHSKSGVNREMKQKFREYCRSMDGEWTPKVQIKLRASSFELIDWISCIPYRRIKNVMSGAFQIHLLCNDKVQSWFGISDIAHAKSMSVAEKEHRKAQYNSAEKDTKRDRKQKRKTKKAFMFQDP